MKLIQVKYLFLLLSIFSFLFLQKFSYADNWSEWCMGNTWFENYSSKCVWKSWFELYECRVTNICQPCIINWTQRLYQTEKYENAEIYRDDITLLWDTALKPFEKVKEIYRNNQNSIYQCALIDAQERWLKTVKEKLLKIDRTWILRTNVEDRISSQEIKLAAKKNALNCKWSWNNNWKTLFTKKEVLDESTFELCKYTFYLDYLNWYYNNIKNISWLTTEEQESMSAKNQGLIIKKIWYDYWNIKTKIWIEINNTYKVFPLAFEAYNEYENNFQLHFLLTIIREDYIVVRDLLAQVLWPINQLVYKIKDAMSLN